MISKETYDKIQEYKAVGLSIVLCPNGTTWVWTSTPYLPSVKEFSWMRN